jgi:hypothetical protein
MFASEHLRQSATIRRPASFPSEAFWGSLFVDSVSGQKSVNRHFVNAGSHQ